MRRAGAGCAQVTSAAISGSSPRWSAGARVLDVGCGEGALLEYLAREKQVEARGMELRQSVNACVGHGLSVIQGDADPDLDEYPSGGSISC